jgi:hypothetical protein
VDESVLEGIAALAALWGLVLSCLAIHGLWTNRVHLPFGEHGWRRYTKIETVEREDDPPEFWGTVIWRLLLAAGCFYVCITALFGFWPWTLVSD